MLQMLLKIQTRVGLSRHRLIFKNQKRICNMIEHRYSWKFWNYSTRDYEFRTEFWSLISENKGLIGLEKSPVEVRRPSGRKIALSIWLKGWRVFYVAIREFGPFELVVVQSR